MLYIDVPEPDQMQQNDYNLLVATNAEYYTRANQLSGTNPDVDELVDYFKLLLKDKTEKEVAGSTFFRLDSGTILRNHLPMSGRTMKRNGSNEVEVKLSRCVSRIDLVNRDDTYDLVSVSLWNVFPRTHIWDNNFTNYTDEKHLNRFGTIYMDNQSNTEIRGRFYTFENYVPNTLQNDTATTCLIVGLRPKEDSKRTEYYRINLCPTGRSQLLRRNHLYQVTINRVTGKGKGSEKDAYENAEILLSGTIQSWDEDDFSNLQFDEEHTLFLSHSKINLSYSGGTEFVNIVTRGTGEVKISQEILPDGLKARLSAARDTLYIDAARTFDKKEGLVEIQFGSFRAAVEVSQNGEYSEWLEITPDRLHPFPAEKDAPNHTQMVSVDASPGCKARLYNDNDTNIFSLAEEENYFTISVKEDNDTEKPRYSFVTVFLEDNPMIARILLLTQTGKNKETI
ncbi:MAG: hypothetical protein LUE98_20600 [Tannerellaceae bacterium]|nr:hypothetical protein [Tannerellaceae bacterium]